MLANITCRINHIGNNNSSINEKAKAVGLNKMGSSDNDTDIQKETGRQESQFVLHGILSPNLMLINSAGVSWLKSGSQRRKLPNKVIPALLNFEP